MVNVIYHKDGTPQCSQCNTGYEDAEGAEYCCSSCVDCGFRQHGMHERAAMCCPCKCDSNECWCSEDGYCCRDYLADYGAESDDYSVYLKVWLDNDNYDSPLFGVFDTEKKAKAARWHDRNDNVRVFDIIKISRKGGKAVFGAEDEYIRCDWCNKGIGTLEDLESGSVEYLGKGGDIVCMTCVTKRGIPYDVSHAEWHHSNTSCHECGSDDVDYTKVYYCVSCGEDDLVPGEQCSCGNLVGSKDYYEQMICGDCDNAWIEDDYSAETFEAPRKSVSVSRRKKNNKISKTISDIMHSWEKTGMIGKNRPRSRKSAQKMAIAVAYSINNRKTTKKAESYRAEEGNTPIMPPMGFGEMVNWRPLDGTPGLKRNRAEGLEKEPKLWVVTAMALHPEIWAKENQFSQTVRVFDNEINAKKYFNELMLMNGYNQSYGLDSPKDDWEYSSALVKQPTTDGEDFFVEVAIKELSMAWDNGEVYRAEQYKN